MKVYADNAATTKLSKKALETMAFHLENTFGNPSGLYSIAQNAKEVLENARESISNSLNCDSREIYFTSCGSESDNQAIYSCATIGQRKGKKHIITSAFEHHAVLHPIKELEKQGFEVTYLPVYSDGMVKLEDLENAIRDDTCFVSIMYANNEIGTIQPIEQLGAVCKKHKVIFHTDAVQAVGHIPISLKDSNIDMLSLSAHKFHGPKGVGALYVKKGIPLLSMLRGGAQENNKRAGTENVSEIATMAVALEEAVDKLEHNAIKLASLRNKLEKELSKIPHSQVNGNKNNRLPGILNMCFEGIEGEGMLLYMDDEGISVSSGSACTSGSLDPSHVLLAIGLPHDIAHGSLRISLSEFNSEEEINYIIEKTPDIIQKLRDMSPVWKDLLGGKRKYVIQ